ELCATAGLSLPALALNPYGFSLLLFPFSLFQESAFRQGLNEWARPELLGRHVAYWLVLGLYLAAGTALWRRGNRTEALLSGCFALGGCLAWRHIPLALLAGVHLHPRALLPNGLPVAFRWLALGVPLLLTWGLVRVQVGPDRMGLVRSHFPYDAARFLQRNPRLPARMFNPYEWGGYLAWNVPGRKVFMDGRAHTVYPEQVYRDALAIQYREEPLEPRLTEYRLDMVLASRVLGDLADRMRRLPGWFVLYEDENSVLFMRDRPDLRELAGLLEVPRTAWSARLEAERFLQEDQVEAAARLLQEAVREDPSHAGLRVLLGVCLLRTGRLTEGEAQLREALRLDPSVLDAHFNLAQVCLRRGDRAGARRHLLRELERNPQHDLARQLLGSLR
ncbi:MAG: tetratricopeptide repeat protein, partial [Candidatus Eremiobacterota bacterium]